MPIQRNESGRSSTDAIIVPLPRRETITETIARQLSRLIAAEQWKPGEQLPSESELAKRFQAGRSAIREALKALTLTGLVSVQRGKGTFVNDRSDFLLRPMSLAIEPYLDLQSLTEARALIEVEIAGLAAERGKSNEIDSIETYVSYMASSVGLGRLDDFLEHDAGFHFAIARASHNPLLSQCVTLIRNSMQEWISLAVDRPQIAWEALRHHKEILRAIKCHRPTAARNAMRRHLVVAAKRWLIAAKKQMRVENTG